MPKPRGDQANLTHPKARRAASNVGADSGDIWALQHGAHSELSLVCVDRVDLHEGQNDCALDVWGVTASALLTARLYAKQLLTAWHSAGRSPGIPTWFRLRMPPKMLSTLAVNQKTKQVSIHNTCSIWTVPGQGVRHPASSPFLFFSLSYLGSPL